MTTAQQEEIEHLALEADIAIAGGLRPVETAAVLLVGLLVCPPPGTLVVVAVPRLVTAVVLGLLGAVLATPYVLVRHFRGHPGRQLSLLVHRLRLAGRALLDLAPHRIHTDARRLQPAPVSATVRHLRPRCDSARPRKAAGSASPNPAASGGPAIDLGHCHEWACLSGSPVSRLCQGFRLTVYVVYHSHGADPPRSMDRMPRDCWLVLPVVQKSYA